MIDIKVNYSSLYQDKNCRLGCSQVEHFEHFINCTHINKEKALLSNVKNGSLNLMKENSQIIIKKIEIRNQLIKVKEESEKKKISNSS